MAEIRKLKAAKLMKKVMADHFYEIDAAVKAGNPKVAWCTSVGPAELLRAMGFVVYFPENHAAILGASRTATDYIPAANAIGYSPEICSYLTADVGAYLKGFTPLAKIYEGIDSIPKPDVLVYNTNQCRDVKDWFEWYARRWNVPCLGIESYVNVGAVTDTHVAGISGQFKKLAEDLTAITGNKLDMDKLAETVWLSRKCSDLWRDVLEMATRKPSPLTFFDGTIHMGPAVVMRGTQVAVDYYETLLKELQEWVDEGVAAVEGEKYRIYWEGMPIWGKLRENAQLFLRLKTAVVASTYCNSWIFSALDGDDPWDSMARAYTELFIVRDDDYKEDYFLKMKKLFDYDGIIFHDAKTCPNNSNCRYGLPQRLQGKAGIPFVTIDGDLNDLRCYSEEQAITKIEAFIEQLGERK
ncbi:MAG: 2-hydroxyacyl-CoA dehydratase [Deltaproteobacteria bacterium]|nr:2-hydroxyacyl-CoA dehydratase [Candidatus Anaeroferrophillus wilburensis]MBN2889130.1 2-hydroxyacyl-CoA dehydratase [Deltaproteobacteria bacterium]